jgi:hypothetical protein
MAWHFADDNVEMVTLSSSASVSATFVSFHREATAATRLDPPFGLGISRSIFVPLLLAVFVLILPVSARQTPLNDLTVRPCKIADQEAAAGKNPTKQKKRNPEQAEANSGNACLEVHSSTLDVQEHLQSFVREQRWRIGDEQISESLWSFSLELSKEELLGYTKTDSATERVSLRGGKAVVLVKTADLSDGYTRTTVSARFEGFGESDDTFAMKRASWKLTSNGRLESTLIGTLQTHFRANR